jgi:pentatricopeptide repeat domain-containing protein 1
MDIHLIFIRARQLIDAGAVADATTFNILLKACMRAKDGKRATMVVKWMKDAGIQADTVTWSSLIKVRSYTDDFKGVLAIRDEMEKDGFEPTTGVWGSLLVACGAAQHHETALMMWREAKAALGGPASVPVNLYNAMLTACNACGQGERTLSLLEEMKAAGVTPGVKSYNLAIKACEGQPGQRLRLEQLAIALKLYEEMRTCGMHPDLITYGTLIELCAEGRQGALARRLRDRMDEDGVKPNVVVMTSLLKALARAGLIEDCLDTFGTMVWGPARVRPNRVTFRTLVRELRQAGALGAALRAYEGMRRAQHAPSNVEFQELIAAAAEAALAEGDPELQAQVASLCNIGSTLEILDLHGMSTLEARAAVLCVLSMLMTEYHDTGLPPSTLTIITGKGVHSESGQAVLPSTVHRLLSEELHMPVDTENNSNAGRLVIDPEQLLRWVRARVATRQRHQRAKKKAATSTIDDS